MVADGYWREQSWTDEEDAGPFALVMVPVKECEVK